PDGTLYYTYDSTGQLTGVSGSQSTNYSYDLNGNRTMTGYQTGTDNELLSDGTYTYTYNANGQLATKTDQSGNVWTYTWDNRGRLVEVVETNSLNQQVMTEQLIYDVNNNLIGTILNGTAQNWTVWVGQNPYLELNGTGNLVARDITDPRTVDRFFAQVSASGSTKWFLTDSEGSIRVVLDQNDNVLDQIVYTAYGQIASQTNAAQQPMY